jgi:hypothetical protein
MKSKLDFRKIVSAYLEDHQKKAEKQQRWFAIQPNLEEAVKQAALARSPKGKRLSHQRRIPNAVLTEGYKQLLDSLPMLREAKSFEALHTAVASRIGSIPGIGELTIYDTALRIGAFLRLEPSVVFMHSGTRTGAKRLGLDTSRDFLTVEELPPAFRVLRPREIEDVLCIYKDHFGRKKGLLARGSRC